MIAILLTASLSRGDEIAQAQAERLFALKVRPLLKEKCFACHGDDPKKIKGELNMLSLAGMLKGGELGEPAIVPGKPDKSLIFVAMTWEDEDLEMPPKENDRLTAAQIEQVRQWIAAGAPWPDEAKIKQLLQSQWKQEENKDGTLVKTSGGMSDDWTYRRYKPQDLWAYEPIRRYDVPWK